MRAKTFEVKVNPEIIKWSIETSGWSITELSKRLKVSEENVESWLKGEKNPTLRQLENLAKYTKRPLSVFFLPHPPKERPLPKDYRMLPDREGIFSRETILAIRLARKLQKIGKVLLENLGISTKPNVKHISLDDSPLEIAKEYREIFQINEEIQKKWRDAYEAFNFLRKRIEKLNVFVFQISIPIKDARGFTLADDEPFVIVINSKEKIEPRLFTLIHEFGHVLLRESGIDLPEESLASFEKIKISKIERWCNEFASELLFPYSIAKRVFEENKPVLLEKEILRKLSRMYKISKTMLLYNMVKLRYLAKEKYKEIVRKVQFVEKEGFVPPDKRCLVEKGEKFVSLVETNFEKGNITFDQALEYLGIKSRHYEKILSFLKRP
jgi:Zn-dependent peptidase ImmA (M78 family)